MEKILASLMIEILGKPPEYVKESLQSLVTRMGSEKGVKVVNKVYHEPILVEGSKELYTTFAEIEAEFDTLAHYFMVLFTYMPSHVEIIQPEKIEVSNSHLNELSNAITQRLHGYDAVAKNMIMEKNLLTKKLKEVAPHLFEQPAEKPIKEKNSKTSKAKKAKKK